MESNNISDYERALELKQRQLSEAEKGFSLKLQQGWQKLKENSERKDFYLKHREKVFKEFRDSPIIERQFQGAEAKISQLKVKSKAQREELTELNSEIKKLCNQGNRVAELLKIARSIKANRIENNMNEELVALVASKNKQVASNNEPEFSSKDEVRVINQEKDTLVDNNTIGSVSDGSSGNLKVNLNPEVSVASDKHNTFNNYKEADRKPKYQPGFDKKEKTNSECKLEFQNSSGENININLAQYSDGGLQAEVISDSSQRVSRLTAEKIGIIKKLKQNGYKDVLLKFGLSSPA